MTECGHVSTSTTQRKVSTMSATPITTTQWDVRNGMVYRDGRGVVAFHDYHLEHPNGMTVEQWEASKRRQCYRLTFGHWPTSA